MPIVNATTFADPNDVRRFWRCKRRGGTDRECYKVGDNGIGKWGHETATMAIPYIALPVEDWIMDNHTGGDLVNVTYKGRTVQCFLGDTMPHKDNITNGAGIDLNPCAASRLGIPQGGSAEGVQWEWVDMERRLI